MRSQCWNERAKNTKGLEKMQSQYLKDLLVAVIVTAYVTWYNDSFSEFPTYYNA